MAVAAMADLVDQLREEAAQKRDWQRRHQTRRMLAASLRGYFWMPCPMCGEAFGGHEWVGRVQLPSDEPGMTQGICPACEMDLGIAAMPYCDQYGHTPTMVLSEGTFSDQGDGTVAVSLPFDPTATPLYAYCTTCGTDLPIDT